MISFIIPAYNEEALLGKTVETLHRSALAALDGMAFEIIVVDDDSTDRTAEIARQGGARVVSVQKRQIAAVRNAGAKVAQGEVFIFVDADTLVPEATLRGTLKALRNGAVGGGSQVELGGPIPWMARISLDIFMLIWRPMQLAAGCFIFAQREDFEAVGGFDERFYASEEVWLSQALKNRGQFIIVPQPVTSSGRKARMHSIWKLMTISIAFMIKGPQSLQKREGLELWYDGQRETAPPESAPADSRTAHAADKPAG